MMFRNGIPIRTLFFLLIASIDSSDGFSAIPIVASTLPSHGPPPPPPSVLPDLAGAWTASPGNAVDDCMTTLLAIDGGSSPSPIPGITDLLGSGNDPLVLGGVALAILAVGALAAMASSSSSSSSSSSKADGTVEKEAEPEPEPIDVSIPYDAAVILAYQALKNEEPDLKSDAYAEFKKLYLEKSIAEVVLKQKSRNLERLMST